MCMHRNAWLVIFIHFSVNEDQDIHCLSSCKMNNESQVKHFASIYLLWKEELNGLLCPEEKKIPNQVILYCQLQYWSHFSLISAAHLSLNYKEFLQSFNQVSPCVPILSSDCVCDSASLGFVKGCSVDHLRTQIRILWAQFLNVLPWAGICPLFSFTCIPQIWQDWPLL